MEKPGVRPRERQEDQRKDQGKDQGKDRGKDQGKELGKELEKESILSSAHSKLIINMERKAKPLVILSVMLKQLLAARKFKH